MIKETFTDKLIKRFYGITGPLDEQKRQQVDRMGTGLQNTISAVCGFPSKISLPKSIVMRGGPPGSVFLMVIRGF